MTLDMFINLRTLNLDRVLSKGLKLLIKKKYYIFIITNQAGIGKGIFSINDFYKLHNEIKEKLQKK